MDPENITPEGLDGAAHVTPPSPVGTVDSGTPGSTSVSEMSLSQLNQHLGKQFPTVEAALKSISDTYSYVGRKKEDIEKEVLSRVATKDETSAMAEQLKEMRKDMFYKDNPQYADPNVKSLIDKLGTNPADVVNSTEFKSVFEKVRGYDESQKLRTVLDSNPRLASTKDSFTKAEELQKTGNKEEAESLIVNALLDLQATR